MTAHEKSFRDQSFGGAKFLRQNENCGDPCFPEDHSPPLLVHATLKENFCTWDFPSKNTFLLNYVCCPYDIVNPASRGPSIFLEKSGSGRNLCQPPRLSHPPKRMSQSGLKPVFPVFAECACALLEIAD